MISRKAIPKKLRFEVFKRDRFTCQYCGRKSPDVVLHCDHINPVAEGGDNDVLNLVTSCVDCNLGKGKTRLSDDSAVVKQREQMEALAERREQIDMLVEWRNSLSDTDAYELDQVTKRWQSVYSGVSLTDAGKENLRKLLKQFGLIEVLEAIDIARDTYGFDPINPADSANHAFVKLGGIMANRRTYKDRPYMRDVHYVCGILKNRLNYFNKSQAIEILTDLAEDGIGASDLKELAIWVRSWTQFKETAAAWLEGDEEN